MFNSYVRNKEAVSCRFLTFFHLHVNITKYENLFKFIWHTGHCTEDGVSNKEPTERLVTSLEEGAPNGIPVEKEEQEDHRNAKKKVSSWLSRYSLSGWWSRWENTLPTQQGTSLDEKDRPGSSTFKRRDTWPTQQGACLDEKGTNGSSTYKSFPGVSYLSGLSGKDGGSSEANVHCTNRTRRAKHKGKAFYLTSISHPPTLLTSLKYKL